MVQKSNWHSYTDARGSETPRPSTNGGPSIVAGLEAAYLQGTRSAGDLDEGAKTLLRHKLLRPQLCYSGVKCPCRVPGCRIHGCNST